MSNVSGGAAASGYYRAEGYYIAGSSDAQAAAQWVGKAAEELDALGQREFGGSVDDARFSAMLEGHAPPTERKEDGTWKEGQTLGRYVDGERQHRPGIDLTFSASKSVSIMALVVGDGRVQAAHDDAVKSAMRVVEEQFVRTRREVDGEIQVVSGKMIAGLFRHDTSRALDPQLHTHAVIQNMVLGDDGKWTALTNEELYRNKMLIGAIYRNELAQNLERLGFDVERVGTHGITEIKGVPSDLAETFSKRRQEIEAALAGKGLEATAVDSALAALATRGGKNKGIDRAELRAAWESEAKVIGYSKEDLSAIRDKALYDRSVQLPGVTRSGGEVTAATPASRADAAVEFAIEHISSRNAVYSRETLLMTALNRVKGAGYEDVQAALTAKEQSGRLVQVHVHEWKEIEKNGGQGIGVLKAHGNAPFQNDAENKQSYFVNIETGRGEHTIWGVGLKGAIEAAGANVGDAIRLERTAQHAVTVTDRDGKSVEAHRNAWSVEKLDSTVQIERQQITQTLYTDSVTIAAERRVLDEYRLGRDQGGVTMPALLRESGTFVKSPEAKLRNDLDKTTLTDGQKDAVALSLSSTGRFVGVQGYAGTGKTYAFATMTRYAEKAGYAVDGIAPTNRAAEQLSEAITSSTTIARFLINASNGQVASDKSRAILVVDEAGMVSTSDMRDVLTAANRLGYARVILSGDVKQLDPVSAGSPFMQLQKAGLPTALMTDIQRQRDEGLKESVLHAIRGEVKEAFGKLTDIRIASGDRKIEQVLGQAWLDLRGADRERATILVLTNNLRHAVNETVREGLRSEHRIGRSDVERAVLTPLNLSPAEAKATESYKVGDVVIPQRAIRAHGIRAGEVFVVEAKSDRSQSLTLRPENGGEAIRISLRSGGKDAPTLSAFTPETRPFTTGDRIKFGISDHSVGIVNGARGLIEKISETSLTVRLDNGKVVELSSNTLATRGVDHAYAATAHDLQGASVQRIIVGMSANETLATEKSFYVAISRATNYVTLVTNNAEALAKRVEDNTGIRPTALDALATKHKDDEERRQSVDTPKQQEGPRTRELEGILDEMATRRKERELNGPEISTRAADLAVKQIEQLQKIKEGPIR